MRRVDFEPQRVRDLGQRQTWPLVQEFEQPDVVRGAQNLKRDGPAEGGEDDVLLTLRPSPHQGGRLLLEYQRPAGFRDQPTEQSDPLPGKECPCPDESARREGGERVLA